MTDEPEPPIKAVCTGMIRGEDDAAECARLRKMLRALTESGSTAKLIVMVTIWAGENEMTATITTPDEDMPERFIADAVVAGYGKIMLAHYEAAKAEAEGESDEHEPE